MSKKQLSPNHQSYLVRLWRDDPQGEWRVQIKHVTTGEEQFFSSLDRLFVYWYQATAVAPTTHQSNGETK